MNELSLIAELSKDDYIRCRFPPYIRHIPLNELIWSFECEDGEIEANQSACRIRVYRRMERRAATLGRDAKNMGSCRNTA